MKSFKISCSCIGNILNQKKLPKVNQLNYWYVALSLDIIDGKTRLVWLSLVWYYSSSTILGVLI